jgi:hypothetical protein
LQFVSFSGERGILMVTAPQWQVDESMVNRSFLQGKSTTLLPFAAGLSPLIHGLSHVDKRIAIFSGSTSYDFLWQIGREKSRIRNIFHAYSCVAMKI